MNWQRYMTKQEERQMASWERQIGQLLVEIRRIRLLRRLLQNRAYARGKK